VTCSYEKLLALVTFALELWEGVVEAAHQEAREGECLEGSSTSSALTSLWASGLRMPLTAPMNGNRQPAWMFLPVSVERSASTIGSCLVHRGAAVELEAGQCRERGC
jgi:hypothetical protein